jgi:hypothetical protein
MKNTQMHLRETECYCFDWINLAQNWDLWLTVVYVRFGVLKALSSKNRVVKYIAAVFQTEQG